MPHAPQPLAIIEAKHICKYDYCMSAGKQMCCPLLPDFNINYISVFMI